MTPHEKIDVLICAAKSDINYLLEYTLKSCIKNFEPLNKIFIVTPTSTDLEQHLVEWNLCTDRIIIINDSDALPNEMMDLTGWLKQQVIKLKSDLICTTRFICLLGADTIILKRVIYQDLIKNGQAILYFNRYSLPSIHLHSERKRVENIAKLLNTQPKRSFILGDFIMELMIFDSVYLQSLRNHLNHMYGSNPYDYILPSKCETYAEKTAFGEWTLYCVYILDVLKKQVPLKNSNSKFVIHLHSDNDLNRFDLDSQVVHFVSKSFNVLDLKKKFKIINQLEKMGEDNV